MEWDKMTIFCALNQASSGQSCEYLGLRTRPAAMIRFALLLTLLPWLAFAAETRDDKVRNDRTDVLGGGRWIYNDLPKGMAEAKRTGKPLLVVLRCVP